MHRRYPLQQPSSRRAVEHAITHPNDTTCHFNMLLVRSLFVTCMTKLRVWAPLLIDMHGFVLTQLQVFFRKMSSLQLFQNFYQTKMSRYLRGQCTWAGYDPWCFVNGSMFCCRRWIHFCVLNKLLKHWLAELFLFFVLKYYCYSWCCALMWYWSAI